MQPKAPGNAFPADPGALGYGEIGPNNISLDAIGYGEIGPNNISLDAIGYGELSPNNFNIQKSILVTHVPRCRIEF